MVSKKLKDTIGKLVNLSFNSKGEIKESTVQNIVTSLKKLPANDAIQSLILYQKGLKREIGKTTLEISSPVKLSQAEIKKISSAAPKNFNITNVKTVLDSSLLGGLRIKIGDVVFDDSVLAKIETVKGIING